jgi:hypothetical protein
MVPRLIDFTRLEVYEAGADLLTQLAYPDENEEVRGEVHESLCAYALNFKYLINPDWGVSLQRLKPIYALRPQHHIDCYLRTFGRRMRDRMVAGRMAIGFLKEAKTGQVPAGIKRLSINEMAELVLEEAGYVHPENVETRIWRPSLPVIHLASALRYLSQPVGAECKPIGTETLLGFREVIELLIRTAECHERLIEQSRYLRFDPEKMIRFRLA